jgi:hypothetical protein
MSFVYIFEKKLKDIKNREQNLKANVGILKTDPALLKKKEDQIFAVRIFLI